MPLAFNSESHGTIAFGFFNIESDMLLLDRYFFFAADFCEVVCKMAEEKKASRSEYSFSAYVIEDAEKIGDLHGGIAGTHFSGFIGETYKSYPFPKDHQDFKQQTEGFKTRDEFEQMVLRFASPFELVFQHNKKNASVSIGCYVFSLEGFSQLIDYVIVGGFPRWLDDLAPEYVTKMQQAVNLR
jgi:hypothetical protein